MPKEEAAPAPKPAPPTRYGPTFDEIERRDPVQWHAAHMAWVCIFKTLCKVLRILKIICFSQKKTESNWHWVVLPTEITNLKNTDRQYFF